jgi:multiple sugar transport system permease protein
MSAPAQPLSARPSEIVVRPARASVRLRRAARRALRYAVVAFALAFFLFPIYWMAITAFKPPADLRADPPVWFPSEPTLAHFRAVMELRGWTALKNSLIIAGSATALSLAIGSLAAYALARFNTGGRHFAFWLLSQRFMPPVVLVIPLFLIFRDLKWIDTHHGLIFLYTVFNLPYVVWMMRSYIVGLSPEIEESALVDGSTRLGVLWRITLPLVLPGLIATATFAFIFSWTEFLFAVIFTGTNAFTLPKTIAGYVGSQGTNYGQATSLAIVATAPLFVLGLLVQRHFVRGLTLGAVRG